MTSFGRGRVLVAMIAMVVLGGCVGGPSYQPIEVRDRILMPEIRVGKSLYASKRSDFSAEFGVFHARGSYSNKLYAGQARLGNTTFAAPQDLTTRFHVTTFDASTRWRQDLKRFRYELSVGVGYADLNLALSSPAAHDSESIISPVLQLGFGAGLRILPKTYVMASAAVMTTKSNFSDLYRRDLFVVHSITRHAAVQGGYSSWQVTAPSLDRSRFEVGFSGPVVGLRLNF